MESCSRGNEYHAQKLSHFVLLLYSDNGKSVSYYSSIIWMLVRCLVKRFSCRHITKLVIFIQQIQVHISDYRFSPVEQILAPFPNNLGYKELSIGFFEGLQKAENEKLKMVIEYIYQYCILEYYLFDINNIIRVFPDQIVCYFLNRNIRNLLGKYILTVHSTMKFL